MRALDSAFDSTVRARAERDLGLGSTARARPLLARPNGAPRDGWARLITGKNLFCRPTAL
jgi:hypothetical protein